MSYISLSVHQVDCLQVRKAEPLDGEATAHMRELIIRGKTYDGGIETLSIRLIGPEPVELLIDK